MVKIGILILSLISSYAVADEVWFTGSIKKLYPLGYGAFVVIFKEQNAACKNEVQYHYAVVNQNRVTKEGIQIMYSTLLMAATTGKKVNIAFDTSSTRCYINRLSVAF